MIVKALVVIDADNGWPILERTSKDSNNYHATMERNQHSDDHNDCGLESDNPFPVKRRSGHRCTSTLNGVVALFRMLASSSYGERNRGARELLFPLATLFRAHEASLHSKRHAPLLSETTV